MAAENLSNRCPNCGKVVAVGSLAFSNALGAFVCAECRGEAAPPTPEKPPRSRNWRLIGGIIAGVCILLLAIGWLTRKPSLLEQQRAWDEAHHAEIIALKSEAEGLAIQGKLAEAHAKYREMEKIIGGRQVKEPSLFDMVEVARQDQDRIYKMLLQRMDPTLSQPLSPQQAQQKTPSSVSLPNQPWPVPPRATTPPAAVQAPAGSELPSAPATTSTSPSLTRPPVDFSMTPLPSTTTAPSRSDDPATRASWSLGVPKGPVSDEQIGEAIQKGVSYLMTQFKDGELDPANLPDIHRQGIHALCVYSLATSGKAIVDDRIGPKSPDMIKMLEKLKGYQFDAVNDLTAVKNNNNGGDMFKPPPMLPTTYSRSLRACALATFNRPQDREVLKDDVNWLINASGEGSYFYDDQFAPNRGKKAPGSPKKDPPRAIGPADADGIVRLPSPLDERDGNDRSRARIVLVDGGFSGPPPPPPPPPPDYVTPSSIPPVYKNNLPATADKYRPRFPYDNSNSQYGLLGVWAGAEVGIEVPETYWAAVERHWSNCQLPSGEWKYNEMNEPGRFSMTCAGIATLLVTHDYLNAGRAANAGRLSYSPALEAGLAWLEDKNNSVNILRGRVMYVGYNLFGIERVGLASGFKQFGGYDWFLQLAYNVLKTQNPDGSFGPHDDRAGSIIDTAYVLLFLSRGRHPIMFNKLRYDGTWANRPREVANLTNATARELERPLNWQVVDIARQPWDWADSPILFISGNKPIKFSTAEMGKLQTFVDNGGILFTHAEGKNSEEFNRSIADFARQLFPAYALADLPLEHDLYKLSFNIATPRPRLQGVSNGVRLLMIHSPSDLSVAWQQRAFVSRKDAFHIGENIYLYATGKEKFRNRLDTPLVPATVEQPSTTIGMARLHYQGNWDPEPGAWPRMARKFEWETGVRLGITAVDLDELTIDRFRIAHLTGTDAFQINDKDMASLKAFIESGGTLLVDAAGGSPAFAQGETTWLPKLLGQSELRPLDPGDPLFKHTIDATVDVPAKSLRLYAMEKLPAGGPRIKSAKLGKGRVVFSSLDITSGLLGTNTWGIVGYLPEYCEAIVKNLVLLSANETR